MRRLFGGSKNSTPPPSLDETSQRLQDRQEVLGKKIKQLEAELSKLRDQIRKAPNKALQERLKQKAMSVLKQKKMLEKQQESLMGQQWNVEQTSFTVNTVKDSLDTVNAMKSASKTMKKQLKEINIDKVEDLYDDIADHMEDFNDLQEVMSRNYQTPEEVDDEELMAELDMLEGEMQEDDSYLDLDLEVPTKSIGNKSQTSTKSREDAELEKELGMI
ncbi:hypothetical protein FDP41_011276 [Naegleria fowleri]|uniref:Charged multivesicular body protein 5 n=1 Tax=Naegleria fowleri TaxID=5763 RepID=A0A6A5C3N0_NAEFO|nr:uncharacterized protein FDP41_011276 [Naegleria fowleri]KAF0982346.1 hypothetical protein FDP41_011276 [Naegleria fowleri]CAG4708327.1 unnamed protein product [Naegleria fowleri]